METLGVPLGHSGLGGELDWVMIETWECDVHERTRDVIETVRHAHG